MGATKGREGRKLEQGDISIGVQNEGPMLEHSGRKVAHDRLRLYVKVAEHFVRTPTSNELDDVGVDLGT